MEETQTTQEETTYTNKSPDSASSNKNEKEIPTGEEKGDKDTVRVKFMDRDFINEYVKKTTVKSEIKDETKEGTKDESAETIREKIKTEEKQYENQFTKADFDEISLFLIDLIDAGVSTGLRAWAKDKSDKDYQLDTIKKGKLSKQLALLLVKYKLKWSIEFVFLLSLCIFYAGPVQRANKRRKTLKEVKSDTSVREVKTENKEEPKPDESNPVTRPKVTRKDRPYSKVK